MQICNTIIVSNACSYPLINAIVTSANWCSGVLAVDRYFAIINYSRAIRFIKINVRIIITLIVFLSFLFHLPRFFEFYPEYDLIDQGTNKSTTDFRPTELYLENYYQIITFFVNLIFTNMLPMIAIASFGGLLIKNLFSIQNDRERLHRTRRAAPNNKKQIYLATKLVLVSITLVTIVGVLSLILTIYEFLDPTFISQTATNPLISITVDFNNFLVIFRASINFLLYCLTCSQYRSKLKRLIKSLRPHKPGIAVAIQRQLYDLLRFQIGRNIDETRSNGVITRGRISLIETEAKDPIQHCTEL